MATTCYKPIRGCRMRVTKLDSCGNPSDDPCAVTVSDGFVSVNMEPEVEEGEEILVRNACGDICVNVPGDDEIKWINIEVEFCEVNPDLYAIMTGADPIANHAGDIVGFSTKCGRADNFWALEVWTQIADVACGMDESTRPFGYVLFPWVRGGVFGETTIENDSVAFTVTAKAVCDSPWGFGPFDVDRDTNGDPAPLADPIALDEARRVQLVTLPPPEAVCECTAVPGS